MISFWLFVFLIGGTEATANPDGVGGRAAGMGSSVAVPDLWSVFNNQAGIGFLEGFRGGIYGEEPFLLSELSTQALGMVFAVRPGAFGLSAWRFGNSLYSETRAGVSYARMFGKRFSVGLGLNYYQVSMAEGYGSAGRPSFEIGLMYRADERWTAGFHCQNAVPVYLSADKTCRLPVIMTVGLSRDFERKALLAAELIKALPGNPCLKAGVECLFGRSLAIRTGITTDPWIVMAGVGILAGRLRIDAASSYHFVLGFSPQLSIIYESHRGGRGSLHSNGK